MAKRTKRTPKKRREWRTAFLRAFEETGMVNAACKLVKVGRSTVYEERQRNEDFAIAWHEIEQSTTERMEREAYRRGVEGTEKPVFQGGHEVGRIREYSDTLLIFMLKSRKPETYRDNVKVEHGGEVTQQHRISAAKLSDETLAALERDLSQAPDA